MSRYIDADAFERRCMFDNNINDMQDVIYALRDYEAAAVRENVKGEWIDFSMSIKGVPTEACGVCGEWSLGMGKNFCPNCGADMRGES